MNWFSSIVMSCHHIKFYLGKQSNFMNYTLKPLFDSYMRQRKSHDVIIENIFIYCFFCDEPKNVSICLSKTKFKFVILKNVHRYTFIWDSLLLQFALYKLRNIVINKYYWRNKFDDYWSWCCLRHCFSVLCIFLRLLMKVLLKTHQKILLDIHWYH